MASKESLAIPWTNDLPPKSHDLPSQVQKIIAQKGALRDILEDSIAADLSNAKLSLTDADEEQIDVENEESSDARLKKLWDSRNEMIQRLDYVQLEIVSALDFVSLLLSSHSAGASASMSAALKEVAPVGSLDLRKVQPRAPGKIINQKLITVSQNLRSQNFALASSRMTESSARLEKEASQQSRYWEQISELQSQGWSISRLPSDSRSIVVHYGFSESAPYYRNRGYSTLRQNADGDLEIASQVEGLTSIRITVIRNGKETGFKEMGYNVFDNLNGIHKQLTEARDRLFYQELFYELGREAQTIANQGVTLQNGAVDIGISPECRIRIAQTNEMSNQSSSSHNADDLLAEFVADTLCMLLTAEHESSYTRRSTQAPPALSPAARPVPEYALLRPVIAQLRHHAWVRKVSKYISKFSKLLDRAGLNASFKSYMIEQNSDAILSISMLREPARSKIDISLPSGKSFDIVLETYLASPLFGTRVAAEKVDYGFASVELAPTKSLEEVEDCIRNVVAVDVEATIAAQTSATGKWVIVKPYEGELAYVSKSQKVAKIKIKWAEEGIGLSVIRRDQAGPIVYVWSTNTAWCIEAGQARREIAQSIPEVIRSIITAEN